jgi:hypothetical protein
VSLSLSRLTIRIQRYSLLCYHSAQRRCQSRALYKQHGTNLITTLNLPSATIQTRIACASYEHHDSCFGAESGLHCWMDLRPAYRTSGSNDHVGRSLPRASRTASSKHQSARIGKNQESLRCHCLPSSRRIRPCSSGRGCATNALEFPQYFTSGLSRSGPSIEVSHSGRMIQRG